ncbi:MAG: hypothetical protein IE927_11660 [Rhodobacterales bacterium]|nr:hypothetical protein [Rhodobacterales bacterium]
MPCTPLTPGGALLPLTRPDDPARAALAETLHRALTGLQPPNLIEMILDRMERPA